ncbi:hypothetical protein [Streptomyces synnematoformans]|uniref:Secreted protein n=1 Tax=Streptomyces synnematoformans TaxID=415721 RepID=A0ABN2XBY1_9ACTN
MKIRTLAAAAAVALPLTASAAPGTNAAPPPVYTVTNHAQDAVTGTADLVMPDATPRTAQAAIEDFAAGLDDGQELYYVKVVRSTDASRYVCRARWYADARAFADYGRANKPDAWPALETNCP